MERLAAEKAERERLAAEQAEAERRAAEKAEVERLAAEKAERERLAAEQERARVAAEADRQIQIDPASDARFTRLFQKLHAASPKYREQVAAIVERYGKPILVREMQMTAEEFEFDACWRWECHIEVRTAGMTDAQIGGLIAFETTNGYQTAAFERVREEFCQATARAGSPRLFGCEQWPADPATDYANKMETIEQQGIDLCKLVLREAMANDADITEEWCRYGTDETRSWHRIGMGALAQEYYDSHFEYWRQDCIQGIMAGYPDKASYLLAREAAGGHPPHNPDAAEPAGGGAGATPPGSTQQMAWLRARRAAAGAPPIPVSRPT